MRTTPCYAIAVAMLVTLGSSAQAAPTPYWFDGYDLTAGNSSDINAELAARQGGAPAPVSYVANSADNSNDYHHQMFSPAGPLQIAADTNLIPPGPSTTPTLASPTLNFKGTVGDQAIGRKLQVVMDTYRNDPLLQGTFTYSAITAASSSTLVNAQTKADGFSVSFVEDTFNQTGTNSFIQIFDGSDLVGNLIPNPAGTAPGFVEIFFNDPTDGDPFDGVGDTHVDVSVNSTPIFNFVKAGGYSDNFITLEGGLQTNFGVGGAFLAIHDFDNLTVFTDTLIPEPASLALVASSAALVALRRRR